MRGISPESCWGHLQGKIQKIVKRLKFEDDELKEVFYRGQSDAEGKLAPSLVRWANLNLPREKSGDFKSELRMIESDLFFEFRARAKALGQNTEDDWEVLFAMQHYGLPTRLLDWTDTLGTALYFALHHAKPGKQPCLWILNPYGLNEKDSSNEAREIVSPEYLEYEYAQHMIDGEDFDFGWEAPIAIYPEQNNPRLQAQGGYFTIHGDDYRGVNEIVPDVLGQVMIEQAWIPELTFMLEQMGVNESSLFPGLEGLARHLRNKYDFNPC
jgi:hypothetical protein